MDESSLKILLNIGIFGFIILCIFILILSIKYRERIRRINESTGKIAIDVEGEWKNYGPVLYCRIENKEIPGFDTYTYWLKFEALPADVSPEMVIVNSFKIFTISVNCPCCNSKIKGTSYSHFQTNRIQFSISVEYPTYKGSIIIKGEKGTVRNRSFKAPAQHIAVSEVLKFFKEGKLINWVPVPYNYPRKQKTS